MINTHSPFFIVFLPEERPGALSHSLEYIVSDPVRFGRFHVNLESRNYQASYDYGSTIAENRMLTAKHAELRRQGLFIRSSPEFYKTDWVGNSSSTAVTVSNSAAFVTFLSNPDTGAGFYVARQNDATST